MKLVFSLEEIILFQAIQNGGVLILVNEWLGGTAETRKILWGTLCGTVLDLIYFLFLCFFRLTGIVFYVIAFGGAMVSVWIVAVIAFRIANKEGGLLLLTRIFLVLTVVGTIYATMERWLGKKTGCSYLLQVLAFVIVHFILRLYHGKYEKENKCNVYITKEKEGRICMKGLWDSGNLLVEPISQIPVCIVNHSCLKEILSSASLYAVRAIPYTTVNRDKKVMYGYPVKNMEIEKEGVIRRIGMVYLAAVGKEQENSDYDILLPYNIFEGRKKG